MQEVGLDLPFSVFLDVFKNKQVNGNLGKETYCNCFDKTWTCSLGNHPQAKCVFRLKCSKPQDRFLVTLQLVDNIGEIQNSQYMNFRLSDLEPCNVYEGSDEENGICKICNLCVRSPSSSPSQRGSSNGHLKSCISKLKRRPKKLNHHTEECESVSLNQDKQESISHPTIADCTKHYNLRGVKLSEDIMKAEIEGLPKKEWKRTSLDHYDMNHEDHSKVKCDRHKSNLVDAKKLISKSRGTDTNTENCSSFETDTEFSLLYCTDIGTSTKENPEKTHGEGGCEQVHGNSTIQSNNVLCNKTSTTSIKPRAGFEEEGNMLTKEPIASRVVQLGEQADVFSDRDIANSLNKTSERNIEQLKSRRLKVKSCKYCSKTFVNYAGVEKHVRKFHMERPEVHKYLEILHSLQVCFCNECGKQFENETSLLQHKVNLHTNKEVSCSQCGKTLKSDQSLLNHIRSAHKSPSQGHLCHLCPSKFKSKSTLRHHVKEIHERKSDIQCQICNQKFARQNQLNRHMVSHGVDQSKRLVCPHCDKGFWFPYNLKRHIQVVHDPHEEKYHCSYCGKGFTLKSGMVSHVQQVHFNIYPFHCPKEGCKSGFGREKTLSDHIQQAHPELEYVIQKKARQRYKYWKSTEDMFYCSHCSSSFCYKAKLVEHMHTAHIAAFPYKCEACNQGFLEKSYLAYHRKKAHNIEDNAEPMEGTAGLNRDSLTLKPLNDFISVSACNGKYSGDGNTAEKETPLQEILTTGKQNTHTEMDIGVLENTTATTTGGSTQEIESEDSVTLGGEGLLSEEEVGVVHLHSAVEQPEGATIHYIIEQGEDGLVLTEELVSLLLNQNQTMMATSAGGRETRTQLGGAEMDNVQIVQASDDGRTPMENMEEDPE